MRIPNSHLNNPGAPREGASNPAGVKKENTPADSQQKLANGYSEAYARNPVFRHFQQGMDPHPTDVNMRFYVGNPNSPSIGTYLGETDSGKKLGETDSAKTDSGEELGKTDSAKKYLFEVSGQKHELNRSQILGYRATVGGLHPRGADGQPQVRPSIEQMADRNNIEISAGDMSRTMAQIRKDNEQAQSGRPQSESPVISDFPEKMAVTTFDPKTEAPTYSGYAQNKENARRLGVHVEENVNVLNREDVKFLSGASPDANIHFQMPRVPRGESNQNLIEKTLRLPKTVGLPEATVTITAPHPNNYQSVGDHNRFYGLESGKVPKKAGMTLTDKRPDEELDEYGYTHRQTTKDESTGAAKDRVTYEYKQTEPPAKKLKTKHGE